MVMVRKPTEPLQKMIIVKGVGVIPIDSLTPEEKQKIAEINRDFQNALLAADRDYAARVTEIETAHDDAIAAQLAQWRQERE